MEIEIKCPRCDSKDVRFYHQDDEYFTADGVYIKWRAMCDYCHKDFSVYEKYELKNRKIYK